jgi:cyclic pyranopterin monophosphate synthase
VKVGFEINNPSYQMIAIQNKKVSFRRAVAQGKITVGAKAFELIKDKRLPKGDALQLAEVSGIMAAKKAPEFIPLCHPLNLEHVSVTTKLDPKNSAIIVYCQVSATAKTGVEMEALAGVNAALLTLYDLTKMVEPALAIEDVRLLFKQGGKTGFWKHPQGIPDDARQTFMLESKPPVLLKNIETAVITASDRASANQYPDKSGPLLRQCLVDLGAKICNHTILPDCKIKIQQHIINLLESHQPRLIMITGGTGLDPKDITPSVVYSVCDRIIPGIGELLRHDGACYNERAWLSCCVAGTIGNTLIISLPGSTNAVRECMEVLQKIISHALYMVAGGKHD